MLVEDGAPSDALFVVATGAMDLVHAGTLVDVLEPGQCFGHPSLLTGLAPAFTVHAGEAATTVVLPRAAALRVFAQPAGAEYLASSLRRRLVRSGHTAHGLPELGMTRLGALVGRPPVFVAADTPVREAAAAMTAAHTSAALVETGDGVAIVTDRDLRERVLAEGRSADDPVRVALRPVLTAPAERTASEALVDLLDADRRELGVTGRDGRIVGLLGVEDIAGGAQSPFALRRAIARAPDEDTLVATLQAGLPRLLASLLSAGLAPADVSRALAVQSDTATLRLVDLAFHRHGPAPVRVGVARARQRGAARADARLRPGQRARLRRRGGPDGDAFFARVAADVNAALARSGMGEDHAEVLARDPRWRMSQSAWKAVFEQCLEQPDRSHLVRAAVSFDFRHVGGGLDIVAAARGGRARRAAPSRLPRAPGADGDGLEGRPRPARPGRHRPRRAHRPEDRRRTADREPRPLPRAVARDHGLGHGRPAGRGGGDRRAGRRDRGRAARGVRDGRRGSGWSTTPPAWPPAARPTTASTRSRFRRCGARGCGRRCGPWRRRSGGWRCTPGRGL